MIKEIKYGRSKHLKLVIPVYIRTIKKDYVWLESDLVYVDDSENMYSLEYITDLIHKSK